MRPSSKSESLKRRMRTSTKAACRLSHGLRMKRMTLSDSVRTESSRRIRRKLEGCRSEQMTCPGYGLFDKSAFGGRNK
jgi:hypothetical protein